MVLRASTWCRVTSFDVCSLSWKPWEEVDNFSPQVETLWQLFLLQSRVERHLYGNMVQFTGGFTCSVLDACWGNERKRSGAVFFYIGNVATLASGYFVIRRILFCCCCFAYCNFLEPAVQLWYCPGQVPIGASAKHQTLRVGSWAVAQRKCLNGSTIFV